MIEKRHEVRVALRAVGAVGGVGGHVGAPHVK